MTSQLSEPSHWTVGPIMSAYFDQYADFHRHPTANVTIVRDSQNTHIVTKIKSLVKTTAVVTTTAISLSHKFQDRILCTTESVSRGYQLAYHANMLTKMVPMTASALKSRMRLHIDGIFPYQDLSSYLGESHELYEVHHSEDHLEESIAQITFLMEGDQVPVPQRCVIQIEPPAAIDQSLGVRETLRIQLELADKWLNDRERKDYGCSMSINRQWEILTQKEGDDGSKMTGYWKMDDAGEIKGGYFLGAGMYGLMGITDDEGDSDSESMLDT